MKGRSARLGLRPVKHPFGFELGAAVNAKAQVALLAVQLAHLRTTPASGSVFVFTWRHPAHALPRIASRLPRYRGGIQHALSSAAFSPDREPCARSTTTANPFVLGVTVMLVVLCALVQRLVMNGKPGRMTMGAPASAWASWRVFR